MLHWICWMQGGMEVEFIRGKRQEGRSKVYLTPIFHNTRWFMYTPSKLYAMPLLSSSTVTAFGNYFCVHVLFYSSFSLPLHFPLCFIQNKPFPSWLPTALSPHCTGSKFQFASKAGGRTWAEGLHQEIKGVWEKSQAVGFSGAEESGGGTNVGASWLRDFIQLQPL